MNNEKKDEQVKGGKVLQFIKHNAYYLIMGICLIAIITMVSVAIAGVNKDTEQTVKPIEPNPSTPIVEEVDMNFILPVKNGNIVNGYSEKDKLYYNPILEQYSFHSGVDFASKDKVAVFSVLDGEVVKAQKHKMYGYIVEIKHAKNISTVYRSLEDLKVKVGDKVKKGDVIGYTSKSDISESNLGNHVHFEVKESGINVNPNKYLTLEEK